ncbi:MAG: DUF6174 domain-containing protein [Gemmatimonadaceae bacterium]|jgi:hypothetical protein|nr:DUF6174 domain-containing protein [Gemmatimonadaceae bacterium]
MLPTLRTLRLLPFVVFLAGCVEGDLVLSPDNRWAEARAQWERRGPTQYTYEVRSICFCFANVNQWHRVEVRNGAVVAVTQLEGPTFSGSVPLSAWPTVPQLFERARPVVGNSVVVELITEFDPALGYPTRITQRCSREVADCDSETLARNLRVVTGSAP